MNDLSAARPASLADLAARQASLADLASHPFEVTAPARQASPLIIASPHSGRIYPDEFAQQSCLAEIILRQSEDCFVDRLVAAAPKLGVPLISALFPRIFVDPNREATELDQEMFAERLTLPVNASSPRVLAGLGVIPRLAANEQEIYAVKLPPAEAEQRLDLFYRPYHRALGDLVAATKRQFGICVLLDCHSMPSAGAWMDGLHTRQRIDVDYVLGDCFGASCAERMTGTAEASLVELGARVRRNNPYSGGYVAQAYGRPAQGVHVLQLEINRALYMNETTLEPAKSFTAVQDVLKVLIERMSNTALQLAKTA
ncbi:N-formylglutamate amidohydrolase [Dongia deserti]|uniref:N-formylglutamate amidohydrolase n=1 Tax=Dongia deserti TaxID=2268030 RepID=UPI000E64C491|nr:N-formylglutamate amidohydrolase [Dongia deserti]